MIDLHTHLLPDWDDGARDWDDLAKMVEIAKRDGIAKIALTPHLYRLSKYDDDISLLKSKITEFMMRMASSPVRFYEGTEVFIHHEIMESLRTNGLTINKSNYFFIEFPAEYVLPGVKEILFKIMLEGYIPIISHPERNTGFQERPDLLYDLIKMDCLAQVTAKSLTGAFGTQVKRTAQVFLTHNLVHLIASDAHDSKRRPPELGRAVEEARRIVGEKKATAMVTSIPQAILDNKGVRDWGEPRNPAAKKSWAMKWPSFLGKKGR